MNDLKDKIYHHQRNHDPDNNQGDFALLRKFVATNGANLRFVINLHGTGWAFFCLHTVSLIC